MLNLLNLFIIIPLLMLYEGWIIHLMWGWFVTHTFGGVQPSTLVCMGFGGLSILLIPHTTPDYKDSEQACSALLTAFCKCTIILAYGFVLHFFV